MGTLIVVPTERERRALGRYAKAFVSGAGPGAGEALRARLAERKPQLVVFAGFCGGLDPSLAPGTVILGRNVVTPGGEMIEPDRRMAEEVRDVLHREGFPFVYSRLLSLEHPAATRSQKRDLWNEHGAGGVDMETWALARAARESRVPWLAVRVVIDSAKADLPTTLANWSEDGDESSALRRSLAHPRDWMRYAKLARAMPHASRNLRRGTAAVVRAARQARTIETLDLVEVTPR